MTLNDTECRDFNETLGSETETFGFQSEARRLKTTSRDRLETRHLDRDTETTTLSECTFCGKFCFGADVPVVFALVVAVLVLSNATVVVMQYSGGSSYRRTGRPPPPP